MIRILYVILLVVLPIKAFALIEVDEIMWPFHTNMKPICLPFHWMWGDRQVLLE